jgi:hypothetical protein
MPEFQSDLEDEPDDVQLLLHGHAGHGFVQQQQVGLHGEHPTELDALLYPVGQLTHRLPAVLLDLQQVDHPLHRFARIDLVLNGGPEEEAAGEHAGLLVDVSTEEQVVQHAQAREQAQVLEGSRQPVPHDVVGLPTDQVDGLTLTVRVPDGGTRVRCGRSR